MGSKLFFDLSRMENIDKMIPNLIRELGSRGRVRSMESLTVAEGKGEGEIGVEGEGLGHKGFEAEGGCRQELLVHLQRVF